MKYDEKNKAEYIAKLKKKYGELVEPNEFDDDIYIKIEEAKEDIKNGRVYTQEEFDARMKDKFPFLRDNYNMSKFEIIAEKGESYKVD